MRKQWVNWTRSAIVLAGLCAFFAAPKPAAAGKSFIYVNDNLDGPNAVEILARDEATGRLTHLGRQATGGMGDPFTGGFEQHSVVSNGKSLYVVNPGPQPGAEFKHGTVSAFRVRGDGSLQLLNVVDSGGRRPVALAVHGDLLYVANQGTIPGGDDDLAGSYSGFRVRGNGSLEPIPNSTVQTPRDSSPADILFTADGSKLVGMELVGNTIDSFKVDKNGRLTNQHKVTAGGGPFGSSFSPTKPNQLFVTLAVPELFGPPAPGVGSYKITADARLNLIENKTDVPSRDPCWIQFTHFGGFFWTDSFIPRTLTLYEVNGNGTTDVVSTLQGRDDPGVPAGVIIGGTDLALSNNGMWLYQLRAFSVPDGAVPVQPRIHVYRVTRNWEKDAGLSFTQSALLPEDLSEAGVMGLAIVDR